MRGFGLVMTVLVALLPFASLPAMADEPLLLTWHKARVLRLERDAKTVVVSDPSVIDVNLENPRVLILVGTTVGESGLIILDAEHNEVMSTVVTVVPELQRHVSITRGCGESKECMAEEEMICGPRCSRVRSPGLPAGAPAAAAPAAPAAAPQGAPAAPGGGGDSASGNIAGAAAGLANAAGGH